MGKLYDSWRGAGKVTLDCNLLTGSYEDRSLYKNEVTVQGTPQWSAGPQGWGMNFNGTERLIVSDNASIRTPKTILLVSEKPTTWSIIISKRDGTGIDYDVAYQPSGLMTYFTTGATTRSGIAASNYVLVVPEVLRWHTASGVFNDSATPIVTSTTRNLSIGNLYTGSQYPMRRPIYRAMLLNQALSQTAAQDLLAELLVERYPTKAYYFQQETITKQIGTPALHWDLKERDASGQFPDLSGNGRGSTTSRSTKLGSSQFFAGNPNSVVVGAGLGTAAISGENWAISITSKPASLANSPMIIAGSASALGLIVNYDFGSKLLTVFVGGGAKTWSFPTMRVGRTYHIFFSKAGVGSTYVNGKQLPAFSGALGATPAIGDLRIGNSAAFPGTVYAGSLSQLRIVSSTYNVRQLYLEGSRVASCTKVDLLPVSLANLTTANMQLEDTPWRLASGQWSVVTGKAINCVAAGAWYEPAEEIGGTITTSMVWSSGTMAIGWTTVKGNATATGQNAYWARIDSNTIRITKSVAGVETVLATGGSIVAGKRYDVYFTWEFDGTLTLWIKEFGTSNWIKTATATDTAVATNTFCCLYSTAASNQWRGDLARNEIALLPEEWSV